ncbi:MAG TPA: hypothetical protein PKH10_13010, partial [bacterium]|nr:hypothetical protein [bacterium]
AMPQCRNVPSSHGSAPTLLYKGKGGGAQKNGGWGTTEVSLPFGMETKAKIDCRLDCATNSGARRLGKPG